MNSKAVDKYLNIICTYREKRLALSSINMIEYKLAICGHGCGHGVIVCGTCHSEHAHIATK